MPQGWTAGPAPDTSAWTPGASPTAPNFTAQNEPPSASLWERANTPLVPQIQAAARAISDWLDKPRLESGVPFEEAKVRAQLRGFMAGATTGAGDVLAGFTSPMGVALLLSGLSGEGRAAESIPGAKALLELPAVRAAQRAVQVASGAGFGVAGAHQVATDPTLAGKVQGASQVATGLLGMAAALPRPSLVNPNPAEAAAVQFGQAHDIPVDAGTATGNRAVKGVQFLADRSIGGSLVAGPARQAQGEALARVGGELADTARPSSVTPEQAGQGIRDALAAKLKAHTDLADHSYETLRRMEAAPTNRLDMPVTQKPAAIDGLKDYQRAQLRRIVHEMDASGFTPTTWRDVTQEPGVNQGNAGGGQYQRTPGSAGAAVLDDIKANMSAGANPTRGVIQSQLEAYLGGGPETAITRAALEVADARFRGGKVSAPELPPSAMDVPTRLEATRPKFQDMGLPVDLRDAKTALTPLYEQMKRQMPVTQQQSSYGLKAIENILQAPDYAPLSQVDRDLSAIKSIARDHGGMAKLAVARVDAAVRAAAANGGDAVVQTLQQGRQATAAKYGTQDLIDALPGGKMEEPLAVYRAATAPKDGGIEFLRTVSSQTPQVLPQIARAKLEELLTMGPDKQFAEWSKLGTQTKRLLFPQAGQSQALDHFFLLSKKLAENPNPSGTAYVGSLGVQGAAFWTNPVASIIGQVGAAGLSKLLHSPAGVQALTGTLTVSRIPGASAARAAALASLSRTGQSMGLPALVPSFGQTDANTPQ